MFDGDYTKTTQFLLPVLDININNKYIAQYFLNAYLSDVGHENKYESSLFLLFNTDSYNYTEWKKLYTKLLTFPTFLTEYDVGVDKKTNKYLLMMVFKIPKIYEKDYYKFRQSKYSEFSNELKSKFTDKNNILYQIIYKNTDLKNKVEKMFNVKLEENDEIWDKIRLEKEVYRYKNKK